MTAPRARLRGSIVGGSLLFAATAAGCGDEPKPTGGIKPIAGSACFNEGLESCQTDQKIYRCESGVLVFVRTATDTSRCPVIGYVGITEAGRRRTRGRRVRPGARGPNPSAV